MSNAVKQLIIECWFRKLIELELSIEDIAKIIIEFADEYEQFDPEKTSKDLKLENDNLDVYLPTIASLLTARSFGLLDATPGRKYHWKIKILDEMSGNIGIIEADKYISFSKGTDGWWYYPYGYAYYSGKDLYNDYENTTYIVYGEEYDVDDIIDVWLDLKDNYDLSFGKNEKKFGKAFDLKKDTTYKLAIGLYSGGVRLMSFEINE